MANNVTATLNEDGTMAVTYRGETRTFPAYSGGEWVCARRVFSGKFRTGQKLWPLSVTLWKQSGRAVVDQGGFSNKGGAVAFVGWWNEESTHNTEYNGAR